MRLIAQLVQLLRVGLYDRGIGVRFQSGAECPHFTKTSHPVGLLELTSMQESMELYLHYTIVGDYVLATLLLKAIMCLS
jgi:hypothetical protein